LGHLDRTQALRLAQALEAVTQLQEQLAFHDQGIFLDVHLSDILDKICHFVYFYRQTNSKTKRDRADLRTGTTKAT
jgi:hypothetical protein